MIGRTSGASRFNIDKFSEVLGLWSMEKIVSKGDDFVVDQIYQQLSDISTTIVHHSSGTKHLSWQAYYNKKLSSSEPQMRYYFKLDVQLLWLIDHVDRDYKLLTYLHRILTILWYLSDNWKRVIYVVKMTSNKRIVYVGESNCETNELNSFISNWSAYHDFHCLR